MAYGENVAGKAQKGVSSTATGPFCYDPSYPAKSPVHGSTIPLGQKFSPAPALIALGVTSTGACGGAPGGSVSRPVIVGSEIP